MCVYRSKSRPAFRPSVFVLSVPPVSLHPVVIKVATMRRRAANKKLISYRSPSRLPLSRELIRSLIGEQATQLYSYKRKLHQEVPITFHGNCWLTLVLRFLRLHALLSTLDFRGVTPFSSPCFFFFAFFRFSVPIPIPPSCSPPPSISLALSASALSLSRGK